MTDRIEKTAVLSAPLDRVWDALTDYRQFGAWFLVDLDTPFREGEITYGRITHPEAEGMIWESVTCKIQPKSYFSLIWYHNDLQAEGHQERLETLVEFSLEPLEDGTRLTITESGFDGFPAGIGEKARLRNEGGWAEQVRNITVYIDG